MILIRYELIAQAKTLIGALDWWQNCTESDPFGEMLVKLNKRNINI
jgi:hypothetical protein